MSPDASGPLGRARARLEALQAAVHREEEWGGVQRQLAECREQCRAAKEDATRKAKAAETLKVLHRGDNKQGQRTVAFFLVFLCVDLSKKSQIGGIQLHYVMECFFKGVGAVFPSVCSWCAIKHGLYVSFILMSQKAY